MKKEETKKTRARRRAHFFPFLGFCPLPGDSRESSRGFQDENLARRCCFFAANGRALCVWPCCLVAIELFLFSRVSLFSLFLEKQTKKNFLQAPKPSPGPHKQRECLPLVIMLRNRLKYVSTCLRKERMANSLFLQSSPPSSSRRWRRQAKASNQWGSSIHSRSPLLLQFFFFFLGSGIAGFYFSSDSEETKKNDAAKRDDGFERGLI